MKFTMNLEDLVNGKKCNESFNRREAIRKNQEFKAFFSTVDPLYKNTTHLTHPNFEARLYFRKNSVYSGTLLS